MRNLLLVVILFFAFVMNASAEKHEAHHEHHAPHQGTLIVLGEEFAHLELVLDSEDGQLRAYALDGEAENALRLVQPDIQLNIQLNENQEDIDIVLKAIDNVLTGEVIGDTSEFSGQHDLLKNVSQFKGIVKSVDIKGQSFKNIEFDFPEGNEHHGEEL